MNNNTGWIVTKDYIGSDTVGEVRDVSVVGPRSVSDELAARLCAGEGVRFKMYDDDNELYYEGRAINCDFEPLDDYGTPNAGATSIWYAGKNGKFEQI